MAVSKQEKTIEKRLINLIFPFSLAVLYINISSLNADAQCFPLTFIGGKE